MKNNNFFLKTIDKIVFISYTVIEVSLTNPFTNGTGFFFIYRSLSGRLFSFHVRSLTTFLIRALSTRRLLNFPNREECRYLILQKFSQAAYQQAIHTRRKELGVSDHARMYFMGHSLGALGNASTDLSDEYLLREGEKLNH